MVDRIVIRGLPLRPLTKQIDELGGGEFAWLEERKQGLNGGRHQIDHLVDPIGLNQIAMLKR